VAELQPLSVLFCTFFRPFCTFSAQYRIGSVGATHGVARHLKTASNPGRRMASPLQMKVENVKKSAKKVEKGEKVPEDMLVYEHVSFKD
jgi:hypothetical protein